MISYHPVLQNISHLMSFVSLITYLINFEDENQGKLRWYTDYKILFKNPVGNKAHEDTTYIYKIYTCIHDSNIMAKTVQ